MDGLLSSRWTAKKESWGEMEERTTSINATSTAPHYYHITSNDKTKQEKIQAGLGSQRGLQQEGCWGRRGRADDFHQCYAIQHNIIIIRGNDKSFNKTNKQCLSNYCTNRNL